MVSMQEPVPEHAPDHPLNVDPLAGPAVRVTIVPAGKSEEATEQVVSQVSPTGDDVTVPLPVVTNGLVATVKVKLFGVGDNVDLNITQSVSLHL